MATSRIPLSALIKNPVVRAAFERADRDNGQIATVPVPGNPSLIGSAGASLKWRKQLETIASSRSAIEDHIESLIVMLDEVDGDENLEPALGWPLGVYAFSTEAYDDGDREYEDEREEDHAERGIGDLDGLYEQHPVFYRSEYTL